MSISCSSPRWNEAKSPAPTTTSASVDISTSRLAWRSSRCTSLNARSRTRRLAYAQRRFEIGLCVGDGRLGRLRLRLRLLDLRDELRRDAQERLDQLGVEVLAALALDLRERLVRRPRVLVRAFRAEGVEHVADRADAAGHRDLVAAQPERVARPVPALVVGQR